MILGYVLVGLGTYQQKVIFYLLICVSKPVSQNIIHYFDIFSLVKSFHLVLRMSRTHGSFPVLKSKARWRDRQVRTYRLMKGELRRLP